MLIGRVPSSILYLGIWPVLGTCAACSAGDVEGPTLFDGAAPDSAHAGSPDASAGADGGGDAGNAGDACTPTAVLWTANHETGDLSQYNVGGTYGGSFDSDCIRPGDGVASEPEPVFDGTYAMKMTADIDQAKPACRQFRYEESSLGHSSSAHTQPNPLYFDLWMYFPAFYEVQDWSNIIQLKSKTYDKVKNDAFWVLELRNRPDQEGAPSMYLMLRYKGLYPGPHQGEPATLQHFHHDQLDVTVPVAQWFNVRLYLRQSTNAEGGESNYDGRLIVWQDGHELYDMENVATRYPDSWDEWSVNVYTSTNGTHVEGSPADFTVYVDEVEIGTCEL